MKNQDNIYRSNIFYINNSEDSNFKREMIKKPSK